jgi:hypothetical protein
MINGAAAGGHREGGIDPEVDAGDGQPGTDVPG